MFKQIKTRVQNKQPNPNRNNTACRLAKKYQWEYVAGTFHGNYTFKNLSCVITLENGVFCAYLTFPTNNEALIRETLNHRQLNYIRQTPTGQIVVGWEYERVFEPVGSKYDEIINDIRRISSLFNNA